MVCMRYMHGRHAVCARKRLGAFGSTATFHCKQLMHLLTCGSSGRGRHDKVLRRPRLFQGDGARGRGELDAGEIWGAEEQSDVLLALALPTLEVVHEEALVHDGPVV